MWTHEYSVKSSADPTRLWTLLSNVNGWADWNNGIETIRMNGPLQLGASFDMTPPGQPAIRSTIIALEPPMVLTDHTEFAGVSITVEHRLTRGPDGTSTISFVITVAGDDPEEVLAAIGQEVSVDFPDVIGALAATAAKSS